MLHTLVELWVGWGGWGGGGWVCVSCLDRHARKVSALRSVTETHT